MVHRSTLLDGVVDLFEAYWRRAVPLSTVLADRAGHDAGPGDGAAAEAVARSAGEDTDPDDRGLLAMLVSGLKDEAVARQLGWSLRTMRRRVQRLHQRLDATNRFQAGVQAARRGWI
ncbi:helix-turn-helix transcriptional regulator [Actinocatenispora sera]|uniref:helix-turn-helix transcriptional regulator n=1 Tax=Actinocatenispora sera TaxID=390989 RepID=UPI001B809635|nr:LuxR C-terminal-related transcriptional regulator [Actinocatenispora sera]